MGILLIFFALIAGDVALWLLGDRRLAARPGLRWRILRWVWNAFMLAMACYPLLVLILSMTGIAGARRKLDFIPAPIVAMIFTWHLLILPLSLLGWLLAGLGAFGHGVSQRWRRRPTPPDCTPGESQPVSSISRRDLLLATATALPPLLTTGLTGWGMRTSGRIRVRQLDVPVPGLPASLNGMVIAHLSDVHVGKWTSGPMLREIVHLTNGMHADLVAFTGDLIDFSLDDLPQGLEMISQLRPPVFLCEGNHDLIESASRFVHEVKRAGARLLVGESAFMQHHGQSIQIMGLPWARSEQTLKNFVRTAGAFIAPGAFPLLLAHHPHAFDYAVDAGFPLVLSGHTHGGQLMLTRDFGAGNLMFRYLSGLYRHPQSSLVVSNGAGNWYPLRINAPAEILRLTLRPAA